MANGVTRLQAGEIGQTKVRGKALVQALEKEVKEGADEGSKEDIEKNDKGEL